MISSPLLLKFQSLSLSKPVLIIFALSNFCLLFSQDNTDEIFYSRIYY